MNSRRPAFRVGSLAAIAGLLALWTFHEKSERPPASRYATRSRLMTVVARGSKSFEALPASGVELTEAKASSAALAVWVAARLREWESEDDPELRPGRTQALERALASDGRTMAEQLKIIETLPAKLMNFAFGLPSFQQWMFSHPQAAADWIGDHPAISDARVLTLFQAWGKEGREELRLYLAGLPDGSWKQKALVAASYEAMPGNPVEAIVWSRQINAGGPRNGLLEIATEEWARRDAEAAGRWVSQVDDPVLHEQLIGALMIGYADTAPELAAQWGIVLLPPGKTLDRSAAEIAGAWAKKDPAAAGAWVARFPPGETRQMALGNLLSSWTDRDAALAWIRSLPDLTLRAQAAEFVGLPGVESVSP